MKRPIVILILAGFSACGGNDLCSAYHQRIQTEYYGTKPYDIPRTDPSDGDNRLYFVPQAGFSKLVYVAEVKNGRDTYMACRQRFIVHDKALFQATCSKGDCVDALPDLSER